MAAVAAAVVVLTSPFDISAGARHGHPHRNCLVTAVTHGAGCSLPVAGFVRASSLQPKCQRMQPNYIQIAHCRRRMAHMAPEISAPLLRFVADLFGDSLVDLSCKLGIFMDLL